MKNKEEKRSIQTVYGEISYQLIRKKVKNYNLRIKPDGKLNLSVPYNVTAKQADIFILEKQHNIFKYLNRLKNLPKNKEVQLVNGSSVSYLGEKIIVKTTESDCNKIYNDDEYLHMHLKPNVNMEEKKKLYKAWVKNKCQEIFTEINIKVYKKFEKYNVPFANIGIREMSSRWGSCSPHKQKITMNSVLINVRVELIEYVFTHEYAHFIHPNHSGKFYELLYHIMPDWKTFKMELETVGIPHLCSE